GHALGGEKRAIREFAVAIRVLCCVRNRVVHRLMDKPDLTTLLCEDGDSRRHVATDGITCDGEAGGVEALGVAVLSDPARGSVRLLDRNRIMSPRGAIVFDER